MEINIYKKWIVNRILSIGLLYEKCKYKKYILFK